MQDLENKQPELEQYLRVYNFDKEPCAKESHNKRKQNCKDNPNCLFGFGENKEIPLSIDVNADPSQILKSDNSTPSGLKVYYLFLPYGNIEELRSYLLHEYFITNSFLE